MSYPDCLNNIFTFTSMGLGGKESCAACNIASPSSYECSVTGTPRALKTQRSQEVLVTVQYFTFDTQLATEGS